VYFARKLLPVNLDFNKVMQCHNCSIRKSSTSSAGTRISSQESIDSLARSWDQHSAYSNEEF
jgi:hypothetical protein